MLTAIHILLLAWFFDVPQVSSDRNVKLLQPVNQDARKVENARLILKKASSSIDLSQKVFNMGLSEKVVLQRPLVTSESR
jgi:hypothetical protein